MTNLDKISAALSEWLFNVAKSALPQVKIPANSSVGHLMGLIGADPTTYSVWNELGFLAQPLIKTTITPMLSKALQDFPDEQLPELAQSYADAFLTQAQEKGFVNLFGIHLGPNAFQGLKDILNNRLQG